MVSNAKRNSEQKSYVSPDIQKAITDGQKLISYIARQGELVLDPTLSQQVIEAKHKVAKGEWSEEDEASYLVCYDKLATLVHPVTVESIDSVVPADNAAPKSKTKAEKAVGFYRRCTLISLAVLILTQVYWLFGNDLRQNLQTIFDTRESTQLELDRADDPNSDNGKALTAKLEVDNQELDANYKWLIRWNSVWRAGSTFDQGLPEYFRKRYEVQKQNLEKDPQANQQALEDLELHKSLHEVRIVFFENILAADFILSAFQNYLLPLLYGLLGAFIYVLRELMREIKLLTYSFDSEIRYRLRLTLGALGGMVIGWIMKSDDASALASMQPMTLAFLMGYNVEVLFAIMDKVIDNIRASFENKAKSDSAPPAPAPTPAMPATASAPPKPAAPN